MPGATTARDVFLEAAIDWNAFMMPHTVPNKPTKGETEPMEARKFMPFSILSISRVMVKFMERSIRSTNEALRSARPATVRPLAEALRHSRMAAEKTRACALLGFAPVAS